MACVVCLYLPQIQASSNIVNIARKHAGLATARVPRRQSFGHGEGILANTDNGLLIVDRGGFSLSRSLLTHEGFEVRAMRGAGVTLPKDRLLWRVSVLCYVPFTPAESEHSPAPVSPRRRRFARLWVASPGRGKIRRRAVEDPGMPPAIFGSRLQNVTH